MTTINRQQYEYALARIEELLPITPETMPATDPLMVELTLLSELVEQYERVHYPIGTPSVADLIRSALSECALSQRQLAEAIGVSPSRISDYLSGRSEPSLRHARLLCQTLHIPAEAMLGL